MATSASPVWILYICAFGALIGFIVHATQNNLQVQNYSPPPEPFQLIITTERVLETVDILTDRWLSNREECLC